ncbi:hypothetical protein ACMGD3_24110 [Lysinibacillus sphaericus]|uniref:hypothetical protein n=1 Tax=Lysinibacillus sphaericus TaxID=1421 RepID=UPI003F78E1F4
MAETSLQTPDRYQDVLFDEPVIDMFFNLIVEDEELSAVLVHILNSIQTKELVTIKSITNSVCLERRVLLKKGKRKMFDIQKENMSRGAATKAVENLIKMSLLHVRYDQRLKIYALTKRGLQVGAVVYKHFKEQQEATSVSTFHTTSATTTITPND